MIEQTWRTLENVPVPSVLTELRRLLADGERVLHVGTDAQKFGRRVVFVTCVVVLCPGKGGRVFHARVQRDRREVRSLRQKLFTEAWMSVETAMELAPHLPDDVPIIVHLDVNPDVRWASSRHIQEVGGLVVGQGFEVLFKPNAWAASHAADHVVKRHGAATATATASG